MRHVKSVLIVVLVVCLPAIVGLRGAAAVPSQKSVPDEESAQTESEREKLVGTYQLIGRETKDANGTWQPTSKPWPRCLTCLSECHRFARAYHPTMAQAGVTSKTATEIPEPKNPHREITRRGFYV